MAFLYDTCLRLNIPCRHLIAALNAMKNLFEISVQTGQCYQVTTKQTTIGAMLIPEGHGVVNNQGVPPAKYIRRTGRTKKRLIRSRGEETGDRVCNGVPPLHDNLHKVNIKYEYCVRTSTIFSQYIAK